MKNIEDMAKMWSELDHKLDLLVAENRRLASEIRNNRYKTSRDRLIGKYWGFIIMELVCLLFFPLFIFTNPFTIEQFRLPTAIYWGCFFLFEIAADTYLLLKVRRIDIYNDSISEIAAGARKNWKIHKIAIAVGLPIAIVGVVLFAMCMGADSEMIAGICVGAVIGLAIGLGQLRKFMNSYRSLQGSDG